MKTLGDQFRDEGRQEGRLEGKRKGRLEGQLEGERKGRLEDSAAKLLRLLAHRFGEVSQSRRRQIMKANLDELDNWFDRALTATDIDAVFDRKARS